MTKSTALRLVELPPKDPPLLNFLKTGTLYHKLHGKVEAEIFIQILTVGEKRGTNRGREFTRAEISFSFTW